jgi:GxxExxY protein
VLDEIQRFSKVPVASATGTFLEVHIALSVICENLRPIYVICVEKNMEVFPNVIQEKSASKKVCDKKIFIKNKFYYNMIPRKKESKMLIDQLTEKVIGCAFNIGNELGFGFLEKVYENALAFEIRNLGLEVEAQKKLQVFYKDIIVGDYVTDLIIAKTLLVEIKSVKSLEDVHRVQCLNYLKATKMNLCLLINFGASRVEVKRIVYTPSKVNFNT